jgi:hypothetical protein
MPDGDNPRLVSFISMARQTLSDYDLEVDDELRLTLIVLAALESRNHFFAAVLHNPDQEELDQFFNDFILRCVRPPS